MRRRALLAVLLPASLLGLAQALPGWLAAPTVPWLVLAAGALAVSPTGRGRTAAAATALAGLLAAPSLGAPGLVAAAALLGATAMPPRPPSGARGDGLAGAAAGLGLLTLGHAAASLHPTLGPQVGWALAALGPLAAEATARWRRRDPDRPTGWRLTGLSGPFRDAAETALAALHRTWPHAPDRPTRRALVDLLEHHLDAQRTRQALALALSRQRAARHGSAQAVPSTDPAVVALQQDLADATARARSARRGLDHAHDLLTTGHAPTAGSDDRHVQHSLAPLRQHARDRRARQATAHELRTLAARPDRDGPTP